MTAHLTCSTEIAWRNSQPSPLTVTISRHFVFVVGSVSLYHNVMVVIPTLSLLIIIPSATQTRPTFPSFPRLALSDNLIDLTRHRTRSLLHTRPDQHLAPEPHHPLPLFPPFWHPDIPALLILLRGDRREFGADRLRVGERSFQPRRRRWRCRVRGRSGAMEIEHRGFSPDVFCSDGWGRVQVPGYGDDRS